MFLCVLCVSVVSCPIPLDSALRKLTDRLVGYRRTAPPWRQPEYVSSYIPARFVAVAASHESWCLHAAVTPIWPTYGSRYPRDLSASALSAS